MRAAVGKTPHGSAGRAASRLGQEAFETHGVRLGVHPHVGSLIETREEIAQAIVAEIVAARHARKGGFLRERPGPIHDRPAPGTEAR